jgi:glycopeptide antibiotics resistance protein
MPLGVYCFELMKKHSFLKGLGIAFLLTLVLETVQLITTVGYFTFNDLVSNTLGYVIGYLIYFLMNRLLNKKVIFYIFNAFTVFFAVLATYGVVNTLINIEIYSLDYYL